MSYDEQISRISKLLGQQVNTLKRIGRAPKGLSRFEYIAEVLPQIENFMITDKADGIRGIIEINGGISKCIIGSDYFEIKDMTSPSIIIDCEVLMDKKRVLIYDILEYNNKLVIGETFAGRYKILSGLPKIIHSTWKFEIKKFRHMTVGSYAKSIMELYNAMKKYGYKTDGIIFTYINKPYLQTYHHKWKPPEHLTIDFLVISDDNKLQLWSGISRRVFKQIGLTIPANYKQLTSEWIKISSYGEVANEFFPVPFKPSIAPSAYLAKIIGIPKEVNPINKIIEVSWDVKNETWIYHRVRTDRVVELAEGHYFGNNFEIAELTYESIINPLTIKDLVSPLNILTKGFYFEKSDKEYKAARNFNSYVKSQLISRNTGAHHVIDLASGKGQDLGRYYNAKVKNLLMLEIDQSAIDELITRKYDIAKKLWIERIDAPVKIQTTSASTNMIVAKIDLNAPTNANIKKLEDLNKPLGLFPAGGVNLIVCNFALHYMVSDIKQIKNIVEFISYWLKNGGEFMFTALDSEKIKQLLKNGAWITDLYKIEHSKKGKINVLLPCSREVREEPLVDLKVLDKEFNTKGIIRVETKSFSEYLPDYKDKENLTKDDIQFVSLYSYSIYKKI